MPKFTAQIHLTGQAYFAIYADDLADALEKLGNRLSGQAAEDVACTSIAIITVDKCRIVGEEGVLDELPECS